jgi:hypothetical protein
VFWPQFYFAHNPCNLEDLKDFSGTLTSKSKIICTSYFHSLKENENERVALFASKLKVLMVGKIGDACRHFWLSQLGGDVLLWYLVGDGRYYGLDLKCLPKAHVFAAWSLGMVLWEVMEA